MLMICEQFFKKKEKKRKKFGCVYDVNRLPSREGAGPISFS